MQTTAHELRRIGIAVARTKEGFELPVIDVTHPRFAVPDDPEHIQALRRAVLSSERQRRWIPKFVMRWLLKSAARQSRLVRVMFQGDAAILDSISTYMMKLGAGNLLPPHDGVIDQKFSASAHVVLMRLRTQQMAQLIASCARRELTPADDRPLHILNIGGGPAIDALNALILLARSSHELLKRPVVIHVLDLDDDGACFGRAALAELRREGGSLHGLSVALRYQAYDWRATEILDALIEDLIEQNAVLIAASEGGLFEYGSDENIVANLVALRAGGRGVRHVVGSVTCGDDLRRRMIAETRLQLIPRGLEGFAPLAVQGGFTITHAAEAMWSDQVILRATSEMF